MSFSPARPVPGCAYLLSRAEAEIRMAEHAHGTNAAQVHHALASSYLGRVFGEEQDRKSRVDHSRLADENRQAMIAALRQLGETIAGEAAPSNDDDFSDLLGRIRA